jgi:hypothetical protein
MLFHGASVHPHELAHHFIRISPIHGKQHIACPSALMPEGRTRHEVFISQKEHGDLRVPLSGIRVDVTPRNKHKNENANGRL